MSLKRNAVRTLIDDALRGLSRKECRTCDCFLGFVTQLELDAEDDVSDITSALRVPKSEMHGCLGCAPCPPGAAFASYLEGIQKQCLAERPPDG